MSAGNENDFEMVKAAVDKLGEHFDTVHIFTTRHEPTDGGTFNITYGVGNWFARYGQAREFVVKSDSKTQESVKGENRDE